MDCVLTASRVPITFLPEGLVAAAAREADVRLGELEPDRDGGEVRLRNLDAARAVLGWAIDRWWETAPGWTQLYFTMQHQQQSEWCWAATSVSVALYYTPSSGWTQCGMANAELGQTTCCQYGSSWQCNKPNVLDSPLNRAGVLDHRQTGTVGYNVICGEINAYRPLAWRIGWSGGGGHFAVMDGYYNGWISIEDPGYGHSDVRYTTLTDGTYQGSGSWTHTYFTRRPQYEFDFPFSWEIWQRIEAEERVAVPGGEAR